MNANDPTVPLLDMCLRKIKSYIYTKTCTWMEIAEHFITVPNKETIWRSITWLIWKRKRGMSNMLGAQSCWTLCDPMDCTWPGSSVHGIFQARILEWVTISRSRESPWSRDQTRISCIGREMLYHRVIWDRHPGSDGGDPKRNKRALCIWSFSYARFPFCWHKYEALVDELLVNKKSKRAIQT